eukprot:TRINITY_DN14489_c0_g3_i1.p1 TRINITY_DN14489_c0_g3~~TRINITY_DN14489_c0_g3_i1.p1  ORF type:complete len:214 (-),score=29.14 TRINITY_DN14489_c0_g3_i1:76-669(-)
MIRDSETKMDIYKIDESDAEAIERFRERRKSARLNNMLKRQEDSHLPKKITVASKPGGIEKFKEHLESLGLDPEKAVKRLRSSSRSRTERRGRSKSRERVEEEDVEMGGDEERSARKRVRETEGLRKRSSSRGRTLSVKPGDGFTDAKEKEKLIKVQEKRERSKKRDGRVGPGDRTIGNILPRHLNSGKRSFKGDRR